MSQAPEQSNGQEIILDVSSRVRSLEGRYNLLRDRVLIVNTNLVDSYKRTHSDVHGLESDLKDIKEDMFRIKESLKHLLKELEQFARREDLKFLEKYINLWNPLKLVTESDVQRMIERYFEEKKEEMNGQRSIRSPKH